MVATCERARETEADGDAQLLEPEAHPSCQFREDFYQLERWSLWALLPG
jgi:hypothetical protein